MKESPECAVGDIVATPELTRSYFLLTTDHLHRPTRGQE